MPSPTGPPAVALFVLTTIRVPSWAVSYLLVFGIGTVTRMMLITAATAVPFIFCESRFARLNRGRGLVSGLVSLAFGLFMIYQMGCVNGLFTRSPLGYLVEPPVAFQTWATKPLFDASNLQVQ